jgi:hypothetical protein
MAKITCTEHRLLGQDANGHIEQTLGKPLVVQPGLAAPAAGSNQTAVPDNATRILRLCSDVAIHLGFGAAATVNDDYYPAGVEIVVAIKQGQQLSYIAG